MLRKDMKEIEREQEVEEKLKKNGIELRSDRNQEKEKKKEIKKKTEETETVMSIPSQPAYVQLRSQAPAVIGGRAWLNTPSFSNLNWISACLFLGPIEPLLHYLAIPEWKKPVDPGVAT